MILGEVVKHRAHPVGHRHAGPLILPEVEADWASDPALQTMVGMIVPERSYFCFFKEKKKIIMISTLWLYAGSGPCYKPRNGRGQGRQRGRCRPPGASRGRGRSGQPSSPQSPQLSILKNN